MNSSVSLNGLEPDALLQHFTHHPPKGFEAFVLPEGVHGFYADFDILTTADDAVQRKLAKLPGGKWLRRLLYLRTCFIGTTASEYAPLPEQIKPSLLVERILATWQRRSMLLIVKDVPEASPLLSAQANRYAEDFIAASLAKGFFMVDGQALAYVPIDFASQDEYLARLSSGRRRDIRRKLKARAALRLEVLDTGCERLKDAALLDELYAQYLEVYAQSEIHFDLLSPEFFRAVLQDATIDGRLFLYWHEEKIIGHNLCFVYNGMLVDKYVGFRYPVARDCNLYFVSWMENLNYALANGLSHYIAGWTDPQIKAYLGASFTFTRHAVYVRNAILRSILRRLSGLFESDRKWFETDKNALAPHS
ncbi:GNAT family N-acetyltransferase [Uliginosibacterium gangwonense]|uniref:GNAT family N-acetyltransferase n=1 Tax=Uliginosibacterium gangwonense TaxID=392736 RepID=UPI00036B53C0|nr:GNAT family N-acetyltransferase [Uliginosibacterium gangwonense]